MNKRNQEIIEFIRQLVATPSQNFIDFESGVTNLVSEKLKDFALNRKLSARKSTRLFFVISKKKTQLKRFGLKVV